MIKVNKAKTRDYTRLVLGGDPSIGKTTAAVYWCNNALWYDLDERIPDELLEKCNVIQDCKDFTSIVKSLREIDAMGVGEFRYGAVVIDTMTILEAIAKDHSITVDFNGKAEQYADYSKGDKNNLPIHINTILYLLDRIAKKHGCDIILICHSEVKPVKNTNGENYDKSMLCLTSSVRNRIMQWADLVGYAWNDVNVVKTGMSHKADGKSSRKLSFTYDPRYDAKGPDYLPETVIFDKQGAGILGVKKAIKDHKQNNKIQPNKEAK